MNILDRFTRDRISRYVWGGITIVFVVALVLAGTRAKSDVRAAEQQAAQQAQTYTNTVLYKDLTSSLVNAPILGSNYRTMIIDVEAGILVNPEVARVQVIKPDGTLIFSTELRNKEGSAVAASSQDIQSALRGQVSSAVATHAITPTEGPAQPTQLLETFVPLYTPDRLSIVGVAEIDHYYQAIVAGANQPWTGLKIAFAIAAAISLLMTILSLRAPLATVGVGTQGLFHSEGGAHVPGIAVERDVKRYNERVAAADAAATAARTELREAKEQLAMAEES
jgi:hypothetical protein